VKADLTRRSSGARDLSNICRQLGRYTFIIGALLGTIFWAFDSYGQEKSYWLRQGGANVGSCPGNSQGEPLKAANAGRQWLVISGVITCRDVGSAYVFEVSHLAVQINPTSRNAIPREVLNFDWIGLAVYRPQGSGETVKWLYDEALPIRGTLAKGDTKKIYFGNLKFNVPKDGVIGLPAC
jgi:hypothetical protein